MGLSPIISPATAVEPEGGGVAGLGGDRDLNIPGYDGGARPRAKSTVEQRPSIRAHTVSTFTTPTMAFPKPEIPPMPPMPPVSGPPPQPTLGRATSATATLPSGSKIGQHGHGGYDHYGHRNGTGGSAAANTSTNHSSNAYNNHSLPAATTPNTPSGSSVTSGPSGRRPSSARGKGEFAFNPNLIKLQHMPSVASFQSAASSYYKDADDFGDDGFLSPTAEDFQLDTDTEGIAKELSNLSLDMDENIRRFQQGELPEQDQDWHRLVPEGALDALEESEIKRQGLIFELLKAERDYVTDLETMEEVFVKGIMEAQPAVIPDANVSVFIHNVFGNLHEILVHHQKMLKALFERQRDDHPLIHSHEFREAYEKYIKHYPVAESFHQKELQSNPAYAKFLQSVSSQPRIKKRDLKIFLSRPLTRLVRMNMLIEQMLKRTDKDHDHPDLETLPTILTIVSGCIKATQPGIEAAEQKVKFWDLCENLVFQKGEITDMDLYDKERHLVNMGPVWRKIKAENGFAAEKWVEVTATLLDNYFLLTRDTKFAHGVVKKVLISRPLPLSFVRLASFTGPPEIRREKIEDGGILDTFRSQSIPLYPFTLYHSSPLVMKAYTLCVTSEAQRSKWHSYFVDTLGVHKVRQESNEWLAQKEWDDGYFKIPRETVVSPSSKPTGRVTSAVPFATGSGQRFLAIGCANGIYVAPHGKPKELRRVFTYQNPPYLAALQAVGDKVFNKFIIHADGKVVSYSLELVARFATDRAEAKVLEASKERITGSDQNVLFVRHVVLNERVLLVYGSKKRLSSSVNIHTIEAIAHSLQRTTSSAPSSFRQYGQPGFVPKEAFDVVALSRNVNVCVRGGVVSGNPGDTTDEFMVIFEDIGCYMNGKGIPTRNFGFVKWETKAVSCAHRKDLLLLISQRFIEVRHAPTGRLLQVIEGGDIRLLWSEPEMNSDVDNILLVMRGKVNDNGGLSEKIVELEKTEELSPSSRDANGHHHHHQQQQQQQQQQKQPDLGTVHRPAAVWSEWDMTGS
ncbi:hypothetical protein EST38_g301 [Candolleomyces aberdarensis]|uniref:Rho1 guanine nucleotide exchange factor 1 n=1 Tax=Candolleomyces aberdarensis TaxID=2316362 RepID=A0A4Q2E0U7_9AGAR|nr:hypothetical protein EST38_g301 [Candolleomyces aberdarensis]